MKDTKNTELPGKFALVTGIIMVALTIAFVVLLTTFVAYMTRTAERYHDEPRTFYYYVQGGRYVDMIDSRIRNEVAGYTEASDSEYKEYYALADYYYAESLYKVYSARKDPRAADAMKDMEESAAKLDSLKFATADVDSLFK